MEIISAIRIPLFPLNPISIPSTTRGENIIKLRDIVPKKKIKTLILIPGFSNTTKT